MSVTTTNQCRVCLGDGDMTSIFTKRNSFTISEKLMSLAKVQIYPEDGLPSMICKECISKLDNIIGFIQLCESTDLKLRAFLESNKNISSSDEMEIDLDKCESSTSFGDQKIETDPDIMKKKNIVSSDESNSFSIDVVKPKRTQQCFTCGKIMSSRFRLKTHLLTHSSERPYSCLHCSKKFSLAQNLKIHLRKHTGEKPLKCSECEATYAHSSGLIAHRRKHTGQLPYSCGLCPRSFRTVGHLQYHVRRHTGEKNFECDKCGCAFITRSQLNQHLLSHTGNRPHICCVCGLRLSRAGNLRRHMQVVHDPQKYHRSGQTLHTQQPDNSKVMSLAESTSDSSDGKNLCKPVLKCTDPPAAS